MSRKPLVWIGALAFVLAIGAIAYTRLRQPITYINIATGYVAQQTCACLHVSQRSLQSCLSDYPADAIAHLRIENTYDKVRVTVLGGVFKAQSTFDPRYGCRIVN